MKIYNMLKLHGQAIKDLKEFEIKLASKANKGEVNAALA